MTGAAPGRISGDLVLANRLADAAGQIIRPLFRKADVDAVDKADASPVTRADREAEAAMRRILAAEAPRDGIVGEEHGSERTGASRQWVLDPIDGTVSFLAGRPIFGTLIALLVDGWPVLGIIDQPITGERWTGAIGQPTRLDGRAVTTRRCRDLKDAVLATTGPHYFTADEGHAFMALAAKTHHRRLVMGGDCYNYGLLAAGHVDLVVEAGLKLHDYAALVPIVEGAGGQMCDWSGDPLNATTADDGGRVIALGDPARLDDVVEALGG